MARANNKILLVAVAVPWAAEEVWVLLLETIPNSNLMASSPIMVEVANMTCPVVTILKWISNKWDTQVVHLISTIIMPSALLELVCSSQFSKIQKK